jgi:hypothetical protein
LVASEEPAERYDRELLLLGAKRNAVLTFGGDRAVRA